MKKERKGGGKKGEKEEEYLKVLVRKLAFISKILLSMIVHWGKKSVTCVGVSHTAGGRKPLVQVALLFPIRYLLKEIKIKDIKPTGRDIHHPSKTPDTFLTSDIGAHTCA